MIIYKKNPIAISPQSYDIFPDEPHIWGNNLKKRLKERLGRSVDLVEEGTLKPYAVESANHDKQLIYERKLRTTTDFCISRNP